MKKITAGLISAVAGGTMLVSGAGVASATTYDTELRIRDISPNPVVVKGNSETKAFFDVGASRDVEKVVLSVEPASSKFRTMRTKGVDDLEGWRYAIAFNKNDPEGKWKATAVAYNEDGRRIATDSAYFYVDIRKGRADTRITRFNASPYKVRKGRSIYFSGKLQADDHRWEGVRGERVSIYHRASGSSAWKWVDSARTGRDGKFYGKTRAYRSGSFKAVYRGDRELEPTTSRTDYVRVYSWRR
ncbi:hypothetical protein ABGB14_12195 [Nonomuraea sp. B10E15]|uniref:hypothetical protein n=1 Tax=Nonomuraea sp. B10E15 TaxID=3153560 RepID=UPI00325F70DE